MLKSGRRKIFEVLRRDGVTSRAALAQKCELTRPAVSAIIEDFINLGLVCEIGQGNSTGGKPPRVIAFDDSNIAAIGLDLGEDYIIKGVLSNLSGKILKTAEATYKNSFDSICSVAIEIVENLKRHVQVQISGVGVAVSGVVDIANNEVIGDATIDIKNQGFATILAKECNLPVMLEKRPNAAALGEAYFGSGKDFSSFIFITTGRGVGAGVVFNGEIYRGFSGAAGEIGRLQLSNQGKLEEISRPGKLAEEYFATQKISGGYSEFLQAVRASDAKALKLVKLNAKQLAEAARIAADFFDPEAIILGGQALSFGDYHFDTFKEEFAKLSQSRETGRSCALLKAEFGNYGVAFGGSQIILNKLVS
jgi:predicted NBD/HSP70 family sugar kinase